MIEPVPSILNVDDYPPGLYARTKVLRQAGFTVLEATTGQDVLRLVPEHKPAIVLLDVNLPDMSGIEVCRQLRMDPATTSTTIIHISASSVQTYHQVSGLEGGADGYLVEPLDPSVLIATVKTFLRARRAEDALRRANEELEWFAYRAAHDLNEPLRTIRIHSQLIEEELRGRLPATVDKSLNFVLDSAQRMSRLIDGLLRYAQVTHEGGQPVELDCEVIIARVVANLGAAIREAGAHITHDPLPVVTAEPGLEELFQNLIVNALKYKRESVCPQIHISAKSDGNLWLFSVKDNGIGIEPGERTAVFKIFRRLHGRDIPGSGIGLAISKKLIEANGGTIWVDSEPGVGSTFYFTLPRVVQTVAN